MGFSTGAFFCALAAQKAIDRSTIHASMLLYALLFLTGVTLAFLMDSTERKNLPGAKRVPESVHVAAERRDQADAGDDDAALVHWSARPTTTVALMPPKPNEFDNARSTC